MLSLLIRRLVQMVFVMLGISILVFLIFFATPGADPAARIAGRNASPEVVAAVRASFGLDKPLPVQYVLMMERLFITRDLTSFVNRGQEVIPEVMEAARVDGASNWQILTNITLPLLKPVIAIIIIIRLADALRIFDVVYILTGSGPANRTDVLSTFIYRQMFTVFDFSGGAAASILLVIVTSLASLLAVSFLREGRESS